MSGKGSARRPQQEDDQKVSDQWRSLFGKSKLERRKEDEDRRKALDELAQISQELGGYD